ncbi:T9SS type A sorting domain-containing protein [Hymenobacter sp. AT01-02]|uniref:T9SS type A sorting domain-containing protein n=1 Tax=Hymenobacter sp. AT01-02 TaxID=1571877 RepID=UPI000695A88B|nr:T9SS type A sorting domain-containing protein [Hymenobacter sp. AT01-02]
MWAKAQVLTNGSAITMQQGATIYVDGTVQNTNSIELSGATMQLTGDFTSTNGSIVSGTGPLRFSGTQDQTLTAPEGASLTNIVVDNTGPAGNNRLLVSNNLTVTGQLNLTKGGVRTSATITLSEGATLTGESSGSYVQGNLKAIRLVESRTVDFGIGFVLDGRGQSLGTVQVTRTAGLQTKDLSYGVNLGNASKSIDRIWTVLPTRQPKGTVPLTVSWLADDDNGISDFSQATMWQQATTGSPWVSVGIMGSGTARTFSASATELNRFTISSAATPLPVELTLFEAEARKGDAVLTWATASETNSAYFALEASVDGHQFQRIGKVAGQGTTNQPHKYQWIDTAIAHYATDVVYYRLRQVDVNGGESYSSVRAVRIALPTKLTALAWPVPFQEEGLTVTIRTGNSGPATLAVYDVLGRILLTRSLRLDVGDTKVALSEIGWAPKGIYTLSITQDSSTIRLKVVRE